MVRGGKKSHSVIEKLDFNWIRIEIIIEIFYSVRKTVGQDTFPGTSSAQTHLIDVTTSIGLALGNIVVMNFRVAESGSQDPGLR